MSSKQSSILVGGLVGGILSTSPISVINCLCCLGVIIGAIAGIWYYTDQEQTSVETGNAAVMGAGIGVLAAVLSALFTFILGSIGLVPTSEEQFREAMQMEGMTTEGREALQNIQNYMTSVGGMIVITGVSAVVYAIFGAIGGAIASAIFKKNDETLG
ncbi:hypothetical protein CRI94_05925 [Longibacter salinarum]|uniref:DUF4199 domain-containing protein n=1 Tax=Longibacter salinarum TaxID=1850348 RepID=A0A2A8D0S4_9BACT|nr:DUF4199 family protein [Longibacter salinarum]PEN14562.1 hypothetical protein CRI94_05925 [Longibacter salinarum]